MNVCEICNGPNLAERVAIGYTHCTRQSCVDTWRQRRISERNLALVLMHKQGLAWVDKSEVPRNDMKRAGGMR